MRISDWSSDVCSSDLDSSPIISKKGAPKNVAPRIGLGESAPAINVEKVTLVYEDGSRIVMPTEPSQITYYAHKTVLQDGRTLADLIGQVPRSEERRVGKECVRTCRSRWFPYH